MANLLKSINYCNTLFSLLPIASFAQEQTNPNILLIQRFYEAYATHDAEKIGLFFSDDIVWRIPS